VYPMGVHLIRGHLMGIHLIGVYLVSGCPVGVYLRGVQLSGVQLSGRNCYPAEIAAEIAALILPHISNYLNTTNYVCKLNAEL
jgi:hypothetical protein